MEQGKTDKVEGEKVRYNGLKNMGATDDLNCLLQCFFILSKFRKAIFNLPTENDKMGESIPLALQKIFFLLQFGEGAVETNGLTQSFGWSSSEVIVQRDLPELYNVFLDAINKTIKGTDYEGFLDKIFNGEINDFIECLNVPFKSERIENFYDLSLTIRDCKNIYESFDKYVEAEVLDGFNQYRTTEYGLQDAKKGLIFKKLPPVLFLQLRRFEFDFQTMGTIKIKGKFEFYEKIDLSKYISKEDEKVSCKYQLHGVIVHWGAAQAGHYFAYLRPTCENKWFEFNDTQVTLANSEKAIKENWGSSDSKNNGGACSLIYIRESDVNEILGEVPKDTIPNQIFNKFEKELEKNDK